MRRLFWTCVLALSCGCSSTSGGEGSTPPQTTLVVHGLRISEVSVYQAVKVPLAVEGQAAPRTAPVVHGRDALIRVFVAPEADWQPREIIVRLEMERDGQALPPQEIRRQVDVASTEDDFMSAFNFDLPAAEMTGTLSYRVSLQELAPTTTPATPGALFPATGMEPLGAVDAGALEVVVVPIQYYGDGSGRLPDTGPTQIEALRGHMFRTYPVSAVNITVRPTSMQWNYMVEPWGNGWSELLQQLMLARSQDNPGANVYYYGAFRPRDTFFQYCQSGCVAGLSAGGVDPNDEWARASLGVLYNGEYSAGTFIHEVGHAHGRNHAPCAPNGQIEQIDPGYPYPDAAIGSWGFDLIDRELIAPSSARDFMSYCDPAWVSDYTYTALFDRISLLNMSAFISAAPKSYRMLSVGMDGAVAVGPRLELRLPPSGTTTRPVELYDAAGKRRGVVQGSYHPFDHIPGGILLVPEPDSAVRQLRLEGKMVRLSRG